MGGECFSDTSSCVFSRTCSWLDPLAFKVYNFLTASCGSTVSEAKRRQLVLSAEHGGWVGGGSGFANGAGFNKGPKIL